MLEIICNEVYKTVPNTIYRMNNDADVVELGFIRPVLAPASPLACPVDIQVEKYLGSGTDNRFGDFDEFEWTNIAIQCEKYGWYDNA